MDIQLTSWQKKQCALLYTLSSDGFLQHLNAKVEAMLATATNAAELATRQGRDEVLRDARWGERDTVANWKIHGWPFLLAFRDAMAQTIAARSDQVYATPDFNYLARGFAEYSLNWSTPDEERDILAALDEVGGIISTLDGMIATDGEARAWDDAVLTRYWHLFADNLKKLPRFRVRSDVSVASFKAPPLTGVYIDCDDPYATPQFAFAGHPSGYPRHATTFSYLGHRALRHVGRLDLWRDPVRMLAFATSGGVARDFADALESADKRGDIMAIDAVRAKAFWSRKCTWTYVEILADEFEETADCVDDMPDPIPELHVGFLRRLWELTYPPTGK